MSKDCLLCLQVTKVYRNKLRFSLLVPSFIDILTAGPLPIDPANLLSSPRMAKLMASFEEDYDLVIVDASPVLGLVDALLTGSSCRGAVMVTSIGKITRSQLAQATAMLSKLNLIGLVANGVSKTSSSYIPYRQNQQLGARASCRKDRKWQI